VNITSNRSHRVPTLRHQTLAVQVSQVAIYGVVALIDGQLGGSDALVYFLCVVTLLQLLWTLWSWSRLTGVVFDVYTLFVMAATAFNGGQALLQIFHLNKDGILEGTFDAHGLVQTLLLVNLSMCAMHAGAVLGASRRRSVTHAGTHDADGVTASDLRIVGAGMLLVAVVPTFLILKDSIFVVMQSGYFGLYQRDMATGFGAWQTVLSGFLFPGAIFLVAGSRRHKSWQIVSAVVVLANTATMLYLGYRGSSSVLPVVAFVLAWHRCVKELRWAPFVGAGVLMLLIFPLVRVTRNQAGESRNSVEYLRDAYLKIDNPAVDTLYEMGSSMLTVAHTLELIPASRPYDDGTGYVYALMSFIPNVFWDVNPAMARGSYSQWLVERVFPEFAAQGGGTGYSFIAEAFANFGWFGPIALILLGYGLGRVCVWASDRQAPQRIAMIASYASFFLFFARAESLFITRPLLWYALMPYGATFVVRALRTRVARRTPRNRIMSDGRVSFGAA
jgi:oligosaccharide repeat unit polymerase